MNKGTLRKTHVAPHIRRNGTENLKIFRLDHHLEWTKRDRLRKERHWIKRLGTWFPKGLTVI